MGLAKNAAQEESQAIGDVCILAGGGRGARAHRGHCLLHSSLRNDSCVLPSCNLEELQRKGKPKQTNKQKAQPCEM